MRVVKITWEDIESSLVWNEEYEEVEPPVFNTVGFLIKQTDTKVIVCDTDPGTGTVTVFPRGCVKDIKYL
jgi:hypothetical protein